MGEIFGDSAVAIVAGAALILLGLGLMRSHWLSWQRTEQEPHLERFDYQHYRSRYRRRMQTSGMIAVIGLLIALGDMLPLLRRDGTWFAIYWFGVLILVLWIVLLALGDLFATRSHSEIALSRLEGQRRELEEELLRLRKKRSNGRLADAAEGREQDDAH